MFVLVTIVFLLFTVASHCEALLRCRVFFEFFFNKFQRIIILDYLSLLPPLLSILSLILGTVVFLLFTVASRYGVLLEQGTFFESFFNE